MADTDAPTTVPTVPSLKEFGVSKETRNGRITVTMTLADRAEAAARAVWLFGSGSCPLVARRPAESFARALRGVITVIAGSGFLSDRARIHLDPRGYTGYIVHRTGRPAGNQDQR